MYSTICLKTNNVVISTITIIICFVVVIVIMYNLIKDNKSFEEFYIKKIENIKNNLLTEIKFPSKINVIKTREPEIYPERNYVGKYNMQETSQQVGFIYNDTQRLPLYENKQGNNYYYHVKDDTRNGIRIAVNTSNKNEQLNDNDIISVPELGGDQTIKLYEYKGNRYNSNNW